MSLESVMSIHTVDIQLASHAQGSALGRITSYSTAVASAPCRVVPQSLSKQAALLKDGVRITHNVYFVEDRALTTNHRLKFTDAGGSIRFLYVQNFKDPHEMGKFYRAECEERQDIDN